MYAAPSLRSNWREKKLFVPCFAFELKDNILLLSCLIQRCVWNALSSPFSDFKSLPVISLWVWVKSQQSIKPSGTPRPFNNASGSHPNAMNQSLCRTVESQCIIDIVRWKSTIIQEQHPEKCEKNSFVFQNQSSARPGQSTMWCSADKSNQKQI